MRDYETKKTAGAPEPPSLAPMSIITSQPTEYRSLELQEVLD